MKQVPLFSVQQNISNDTLIENFWMSHQISEDFTFNGFERAPSHQ